MVLRSHRLLLLPVSILALLSVAAAPAGALNEVPTDGPAEEVPATPGRIVVSWQPTTTAAERADVLERHGLRSEEVYDFIDVEVVGLAAWRVPATLDALVSEPAVQVAEPDVIAEASDVAEPGFPNLWGLHNTGQSGGAVDVDVDAPEAWDLTRGDEEIIVAVVDTGIDIFHPDLADNVWVNTDEIPGNGVDDDGNGFVDDVNGWDFRNDDASVYDSATEDRHATHIAGTIAGVSNGEGIVGLAPNVKIMPVKFLGDGGTGSSAAAAAGIDYATRNGATIINASFSGPNSSALQQAIVRTNALVVASAGNNGLDVDADPSFPAAWARDGYGMPNVLSVASVDRTGARSSFSNHGVASIDLGAPGRAIYSTVPGGYAALSGTSMAAPHASGAAALVASLAPQLSGAQLADAVKAGAQPLPSMAGVTTTGGLLNAHAALVPYVPPVATVPGVPTAVTTTSGDGFVEVAWSAPADDGGAPLTGYTVHVSPDTGVAGETVRTVEATTRQLRLDGLVNGTAYAVTVVATNAEGDGPASAAATATPDAPPPTTVAPKSSTGGGGGGSAPAPTAPAPAPAAPAPAPAPVAPAEPAEPAEPDEPLAVPYDGKGSRSLAWACPVSPASTFADVPATSPHAAGVGCASAWRVFTGSTDGAFQPGTQLSRGQLASVLARGIEQALGEELPTGRDRFRDADGTVHKASIDKLAELGIVGGVTQDRYAPGAPVTRAQFAAMLARTYGELAGELPAGRDLFADDDGTSHERSINSLAAIGVVAGTGQGAYSPGAILNRGQAATMVARLLDALVESGAVAPR